MINVLVASTNPVKIAATKTAFLKYFKNIKVSGLVADSGVPDQPIGEKEVFLGAKNRALFLKNKHRADYYVGIEGGILKINNRWMGFGCMCIVNSVGKMGFGTSPWFELPDSVSKRLLKGEELGFVMDDLMNDNNTKHKGGAIGFFTNDVMNRKDLYLQGLIVALVPFIKKDLF